MTKFELKLGLASQAKVVKIPKGQPDISGKPIYHCRGETSLEL